MKIASVMSDSLAVGVGATGMPSYEPTRDNSFGKVAFLVVLEI